MFFAMHVRSLDMPAVAGADGICRAAGLISWTPGLRSLDVLRQVDGTECVVISRWESEHHFERWRRAASFVAGQRSGMEVEVRRYEAEQHSCRGCAGHSVRGLHPN